MPCVQTLKGLALDCSHSMGGIKSVYIANYADVTDVKVTDGEVTSITMNGTSKFRQYNFRRNTASMTSTLNVDQNNGNTVSTDVVLSFLKQETAKRIEISALSIGELVAIVVDANDKYWYLGRELPVMASAGGGESGTNFTDGNRYTITLQDNGSDYPYEVRVSEPTTGSKDYVNIDSIVEKN